MAILKDDGQATLDACKTWLVAWLGPLADNRTERYGFMLKRNYLKHVFKPSVTKKNLQISTFHQDKTWRKLFEYANNYQSVLVNFFPKDRERAVAGIGLQYSHERHYFLDYLGQGNGYEAKMAKTLSVMRGRPFAEEAYSSTLHAFKWVANHADCYEYLGLPAATWGNGSTGLPPKTLPCRRGLANAHGCRCSTKPQVLNSPLTSVPARSTGSGALTAAKACTAE